MTHESERAKDGPLQGKVIAVPRSSVWAFGPAFEALESGSLQVERLEPMDEESMQTCSNGTCGQGVWGKGRKPASQPFSAA